MNPLSQKPSKSETGLSVVEFKDSSEPPNLPSKIPKAKNSPIDAPEQKSMFSRVCNWAAELGLSCWVAEFGDLEQDDYASWDPYNIQDLEQSVGESFLADKTPEEAFFECVKQGNWNAIQCFIQEPSFNNKSVDDQGNTALHIAAREGYTDIVTMLLNSGFQVNKQNNVGNTALHLTASQGHTKCVKVLLGQKGIDRFRDNYGEQTPLDLALEGEFDDVAALIEPEVALKLKKQLTKKAVAHFFNIEGLHPIYQSLEGASPRWMHAVLSRQFKKMLSHPLKGDFWSKNKEALEEYFTPLLASWRNTDNITAENVFECIQKGISCSIPSGFPRHYVSVNVCGDWIAIGNRGARINKEKNVSYLNHSGITFYHIPNIQETFTPKFIQRLLDCDHQALKEIQAQMTPSSKHLYYPRIDQKRGNCTYANGKLDIEAHLFFFVVQQMGVQLEDLSGELDPLWVEIQEEVEHIYKDFTTFGRILLFNEFSENYANPHTDRDKWILDFLCKKMETIAMSRRLQALVIRNDKGKTIPIIEQLSPKGREIANKAWSNAGFWSHWFCTVLGEVSEL